MSTTIRDASAGAKGKRPQSNAERLRRLVRRFFAGVFEPQDIVEFRTIETWSDTTGAKKSKAIGQQYYSIGQPLDALLKEMHTLNAVSQGNIFFGVCPRPHEGARKKRDIQIARCFWADLDDCAVEEARNRVKKVGLPTPTIVVNSGHGVHLYWRLTEAVDLQARMDEFEVLMKTIANAIDGDSVQNADRLLRVPGFMNMKNARNGEVPVACKLVDIDNDRHYDFEVFAAWNGEQKKSRAKREKKGVSIAANATSIDDPTLGAQIARRLKELDQLPVGLRSEQEFAFLAFLKSKAFEQDAAWEMVKSTGKFAEKGREYFDLTWNNVDDQSVSTGGFFADQRGTYMRRQAKDGTIDTFLANFSAKIVGDVTLVDGDENEREFTIEASVAGKKHECRIPANQFSEMKWVPMALGPAAIIEPGYGLKDKFRAAIQYLSENVNSRRVHTHTGWISQQGQKVFLHAGGAIGANGVVDNVFASLPGPLQHFELPVPPQGDELDTAIRALLNLRNVAQGPVGPCLLAVVCRAPVMATDFTVHLAGATGVGKTELAALCQQAFGKKMDSRHLPASWSSTANANEAIAYLAKDVLLVVDDFTPVGSAQDVQRMNREADRLLRGKGNGAGRARLKPDASSRLTKEPRALIVSTGEDIPMGESLRSRILSLEIEPSTVAWPIMTTCQADAAAGWYSKAMAAFIQWIAGDYANICDSLRTHRIAHLAADSTAGTHKRTAAINADLLFAYNLFLQFASSVGVIDDEQVTSMTTEFEAVMTGVVSAQAEPGCQSNPAQRYIEILKQALASGAAHLAIERNGSGMPQLNCGSRRHAGSNPLQLELRGECIGWIRDGHIGHPADADIYLFPDVAFAVVQEIARKTNEPLGAGKCAIHKQLRAAEMLRSTGPQGRIPVRLTFDGCQHQVLHLAARTLGVN
jgi:hypothetical protein